MESSRKRQKLNGLPSAEGDDIVADDDNSAGSQEKYFSVSETKCLIRVRLKDLKDEWSACASKKGYWILVRDAMMSELPHFNKTAKQLQEKWRNLDKIYRDNKKKSTTSGSGKVTWPYFDDIDSEMRDRADISLKGISNIGGRYNTSVLPDGNIMFSNPIDLNEPEGQAWPGDRESSPEITPEKQARKQKKKASRNHA